MNTKEFERYLRLKLSSSLFDFWAEMDEGQAKLIINIKQVGMNMGLQTAYSKSSVLTH